VEQKPALEAARLNRGIRVYDLRHARATAMIYEGRNPVEIAAEMGHSPQVLLSTYAHVMAEHRGERIDPVALIAEARSAYDSVRAERLAAPNSRLAQSGQ
jgi:integrase